MGCNGQSGKRPLTPASTAGVASVYWYCAPVDRCSILLAPRACPRSYNRAYRNSFKSMVVGTDALPGL